MRIHIIAAWDSDRLVPHRIYRTLLTYTIYSLYRVSVRGLLNGSALIATVFMRIRFINGPVVPYKFWRSTVKVIPESIHGGETNATVHKLDETLTDRVP